MADRAGKAPLWCRLFGHDWRPRRVVVFGSPDPGDLICGSCGATTWSTR